MSHDNAAPIAKTFKKIGVPKVWKPDHIVFILDHAIPAPTDEHAQNHKEIREFSAAQGIEHFYDVTSKGGVCHQKMCEEGFALSGLIMIGSDSHTCTYGAYGAFPGIGYLRWPPPGPPARSGSGYPSPSRSPSRAPSRRGLRQGPDP